jgi:hypothetical protein
MFSPSQEYLEGIILLSIKTVLVIISFDLSVSDKIIAEINKAMNIDKRRIANIFEGDLYSVYHYQRHFLLVYGDHFSAVSI